MALQRIDAAVQEMEVRAEQSLTSFQQQIESIAMALCEYKEKVVQVVRQDLEDSKGNISRLSTEKELPQGVPVSKLRTILNEVKLLSAPEGSVAKKLTEAKNNGTLLMTKILEMFEQKPSEEPKVLPPRPPEPVQQPEPSLDLRVLGNVKSIQSGNQGERSRSPRLCSLRGGVKLSHA